MSNLLKAIKLIIDNPIIKIKDYNTGRNGANSVGEALENYIKDVFANSVELSEEERMHKLNKVFSYLGNQNNPPDCIIRKGDALEIKKIESPNSDLALNSSYPKDKIYSNDTFLKKEVRFCEDYISKDMLYIIGHIKKTEIKYIWFVFGDCFCADRSVYENIKSKIKKGVLEIPNVDFALTKELGGVKKVDPLGITNLRIRGMWHIENPHKVFSYFKKYDAKYKFQILCLMKTKKFNSFPTADKLALQNLTKENYSFEDMQIKNPNNPAQLLDCKLITFKVN